MSKFKVFTFIYLSNKDIQNNFYNQFVSQVNAVQLFTLFKYVTIK